MKVNKLDHISIAVRDLEVARRAWEPMLGKSEPDDRYVSLKRFVWPDTGSGKWVLN